MPDVHIDAIEVVVEPAVYEIEVTPPEAVIEVEAPPVVVEVSPVGLQGPPGPEGTPGVPGADGYPGPVAYVHDQVEPSSMWNVTHPLGYYPNVATVDSGGTEVVGDVSYPDGSTVVIEFRLPFGGKAYLS